MWLVASAFGWQWLLMPNGLPRAHLARQVRAQQRRASGSEIDHR